MKIHIISALKASIPPSDLLWRIILGFFWRITGLWSSKISHFLRFFDFCSTLEKIGLFGILSENAQNENEWFWWWGRRVELDCPLLSLYLIVIQLDQSTLVYLLSLVLSLGCSTDFGSVWNSLGPEERTTGSNMLLDEAKNRLSSLSSLPTFKKCKKNDAI